MLEDHRSRYCQSLCDHDLPSPVVHEVTRRVLGSLGFVLGTLTAPPCRIVRQLAQVTLVPHGATLWSTGHSIPPDLATFANGTAPSARSISPIPTKESAHPIGIPRAVPPNWSGLASPADQATVLCTGLPTRDYVIFDRRS
jgi:hypothetical protein